MSIISKYINLDWLDLPNCINLSKYGKCTILNISKCAGEACSFKITQEENEDAKYKVYKRILSLDEEIQEKIARKYYNGKRPWQN